MCPNSRRLAVAVVAVTLAASAVLIGLTAATKTSIEHDEGITFLAAAASQGAWERVEQSAGPPVAAWTDVTEWQAFLEPSRPFALGTIRYDLAHSDIHPPAYFWLLHLWSLVFGLTPASSIALNVVLALGTGGALYVLALRVIGDPLRASSVVAFWALATPVIGVSVVARQYGLLALLSVLSALCAHAIITAEHPGWKQGLTFALLVGAGAATHYHYALVLVGLLVWIAVTSQRNGRRLLVAAGGAAGGALFFVALHPDFGVSLAIQRAQATEVLNRDHLQRRLDRAVITFGSFFAMPALAERFLEATDTMRVKAGAAFAVGVAMFSGMVWAARSPGGVTPAHDGDAAADPQAARPHAALAMPLLGAWIAIAILVLYFTGRSPEHAMGPRYLATAWPFLAFIPALLARRLDARIATALVLAWALVAFAPAHGARLTRPAPSTNMAETLSGAGRIVVDSVRRGVLPRIVMDAEPTVRVFAAEQPVLVDRAAEWADDLEAGDLVVSDPMYAKDPAGKGAIEELLRERYEIETLNGPAPFTWWRVAGSLD